jgi:hypothetical protein
MHGCSTLTAWSSRRFASSESWPVPDVVSYSPIFLEYSVAVTAFGATALKERPRRTVRRGMGCRPRSVIIPCKGMNKSDSRKQAN